MKEKTSKKSRKARINAIGNSLLRGGGGGSRLKSKVVLKKVEQGEGKKVELEKLELLKPLYR